MNTHSNDDRDVRVHGEYDVSLRLLLLGTFLDHVHHQPANRVRQNIRVTKMFCEKLCGGILHPVNLALPWYCVSVDDSWCDAWG